VILKSLRGAAAVVGALILAFIGVIGVELMSSMLHPVPPGFDPSDLEACKEHVSRYPAAVLFLCGVGWWLTVLASCWMATRLGANRHPAHGLVVGLILLGLAVFNIAMLPYPGWFWINAITFPACCMLGVWLARPRARTNVAS
jgi:hypothetical protein